MGRLVRSAPYLILALGLLLAAVASRQAVPRLYTAQGEAEDGYREVWGSTSVGQTFVAPFAGLSGVAVYMGTGFRSNTQDYTLHLRTAPDAAEDLRSATFSASKLTGDGWAEFHFAPVCGSGGQSFYFSLESPTSRPGDTLSVFRSLQDRYRDGTYYFNGTPAEGDLTFRLFSRPNLIAWIRDLPRLLAQDKPAFLGQSGWYAVLAILCLVGFFLAIHRILGPEAEKGGATHGDVDGKETEPRPFEASTPDPQV